jgi:ethanolaminephosphotransferase
LCYIHHIWHSRCECRHTNAFLLLTPSVSGPTVWDRGILNVTMLDQIPAIAKTVPNFKLNEAFMVFGAFGLAFNIITRYVHYVNHLYSVSPNSRMYSYMNVVRSAKATKRSALRPLLDLLPFPTAVAAQAFWLSHPTYDNSAIVHSPLLLPFLCFWGLQFAHQVGRVILAHVTRTPYPWWDWIWIWSVAGALDANLPWLCDR